MKKLIALLLACLLCFGTLAASAAPVVSGTAAFKMTPDEFRFYIPQMGNMSGMKVDITDESTFAVYGAEMTCTITLTMDGDQVTAVTVDALCAATESGAYELGGAIALGCIVPMLSEDDFNDETISRMTEEMAAFMPMLAIPAEGGEDVSELTTAADYPIYYASTVKDAQLCVTVIMYPKGTVVTME